MTVIVTGASGLVGGHVARALRARGTPVVTVGRPDPQAPAGSHHIDWDIRTDAPVDVTAFARRATAVVHCARMSADWGRPQDFYEVNTAGTRRVLDAFPRARFIHLSSTAVYGSDRAHDHLYEEAGPLDPDEYRDEFGRTTALAEAVVTRVRPQSLLLRPARIVAPGEDDGIPESLARFERKGVVELPGGAKGPTMLAHIDTVVQAVLAGLDRPGTRGPVNVADPQPYLLRKALTTYLARTHLPYRPLDARPADLATARAWLGQRRVKNPAPDNRPTHTVAEVAAYARPRTYSLQRLETVLGVRPTQHLASTPGDDSEE